MAIYLKVPDIEGDCIVKGHEDEMQILSFSNSVAHMHNPAEASSQVAGLVNAAPITVVKYVDKSTPAMIQACCDGKVFADEVIVTHAKKIEGDVIDYFKLRLDRAQIIDDSISSSEDGVPMETISIAYGTVTWEYQPLDKSGEQSEGAKEAFFDVLAQTKDG